MEKYKLAEEEYNKLISNGEVNSEIINNLIFYEVFKQKFLFLGENYTIKIENGNLILESKNNFPEATNGVYKGYKDCKRIVFQYEKEHLTVFEENASVYSFPNELDHLMYNSTINVYQNGCEVGLATYSETREVNKDFIPAMAVHTISGANMIGIPFLNIGNALTSTPVSGQSVNKWESTSIQRQNEGLAFATKIEHEDQFTENQTLTWNVIDATHSRYLYCNIVPFAYNKISSSNEWKSGTDEIISLQELEDLKHQNTLLYKNAIEKHR